MLIIFSGLPGVGKTTLARLLSKQIDAVYVRVDTIEHELKQGGMREINELGYRVAYAVAAENLRLGRWVIADTVNPLEITRQAWRQVALRTSSDFLEIEVICSDPVEHRRRVESRQSDIPGFDLPTWEDVVNRDYQPRTSEVLALDLCQISSEDGVAAILRRIKAET